MAIFKWLLKLGKAIGFCVVLASFSYFVTIVSFYSTSNEEYKVKEIEKIGTRGIECIIAYDVEYISININVTEEVSTEYLLAYAYTYYDIYNKEIHLYINEENKIITIGTNGISNLISH